MYVALMQVCRQALAAGQLTDDQARLFFERNFRPLRIVKLGDNMILNWLLRTNRGWVAFPHGIFKVPIYRRPPDLVPPLHSTGPGFPNRGQSLRRTSDGTLVPYYDRGEILETAPLTENISRSVRSRIRPMLLRSRSRDQRACASKMEPYCASTMMAIMDIRLCRSAALLSNAISSRARRCRWSEFVSGYVPTHKAPRKYRVNRSFMFFRIVGLSDDRQPAGVREAPRESEAIGAQGISLTPGRSIAVDNALHVYGTPFFIQADLPLTGEKRSVSFGHLMIAQDTGSAIVGPARADIFWGSGDRAGQVASHVHHAGNFAMLVPRELDPVAAGERMPLPPRKPLVPAEARTGSEKSSVVPSSTQFRPSTRHCKTCQIREGWMRRRMKPRFWH